jgi:hypothetical protein
MGCLARAGCLLLIVALGVLAWLNKDRWLHRNATPSAPHAAAAAPTDWTPLSDAGAKRTADALGKLSSPRGPVFVTLGGADIASYIVEQLAKQLPPSTDSLAVRVTDDKIAARANMSTKDLGGSEVGGLASLLGDRQRVEMSGTLRVIGKGLAEFVVSDVKVHGISLPSAAISRLIAQFVRAPRPKGLDENALPVAIPSYIGDVRIAKGKITLYKNVQ